MNELWVPAQSYNVLPQRHISSQLSALLHFEQCQALGPSGLGVNTDDSMRATAEAARLRELEVFFPARFPRHAERQRSLGEAPPVAVFRGLPCCASAAMAASAYSLVSNTPCSTLPSGAFSRAPWIR